MVSLNSALVVDASPFVRDWLTDVFAEFRPSQLAFCATHEEALTKLATGDFQICLMECGPDKDGAEIVRHIRRKLPAPQNKVAILLGMAEPTTTRVAAAWRNGADLIVRKPYTANVLKLHIEQLLCGDREFVTADAYVGPCRRRGPGIAEANLRHAPRRRWSDFSRRQRFTTSAKETRALLVKAGKRLRDAAAQTNGLAILEAYDAASLCLHCAQVLDLPGIVAETKDVLALLEEQGARVDFDPGTLFAISLGVVRQIEQEEEGRTANLLQSDERKGLEPTSEIVANVLAVTKTGRGARSAPMGADEHAERADILQQNIRMSRTVVQRHLQRRIRVP